MGRVKKYTTGRQSKIRKNRHNRGASAEMMSDDSDIERPSIDTKMLPMVKRKQIFKKTAQKGGRRDVKKRIAELRLASTKLKKRNIDQK